MLQSGVSGRERLVQFFDRHACADKQGRLVHKTQALEAANSQASLLVTCYALGVLADSEAGKGLLRCLSVGFPASSEQAKAALCAGFQARVDWFRLLEKAAHQGARSVLG